MAKKRDTGVATLPNGVKISEEMRDKLLNKDWSKPQRELDTRSTHQTTKDLEEQGFSGFRVNEFTRDVELWLLGRVAARERCIDCAKNPALLANMHERVFSTNGTIVAVDPVGKAGQVH